jgi:hypothetical protein
MTEKHTQKEFVVKYEGDNPFTEKELSEVLTKNEFDDMGSLEVSEVPNDKEEKLCYTVVWHCVNPKCYFAGYDFKSALDLADKIRKKHNVFAVTIQRELSKY